MIRRMLRPARRAARRCWRRLSPPAMVLAYHRVADLDGDPQQLAVTPKHFAEHVEVLRRYGPVLSISDLADALSSRGLPRRAVAITFDDGYADNLHQARPILHRAGIPATVFVATGMIGRRREFWWDELERLILLPESLPEKLCVQVGAEQVRYQADPVAAGDAARPADWTVLSGADPTPRQRLYLQLCRGLRNLTADARQVVLDELARWSPDSGRPRETYLPMSAEELVDLASGDLIEVAAHTVGHSSLAALEPQQQREQIRRSRADLQQVLGRDVTSFSYPFGSRADYTAETVSHVREAGFACACANVPGVIDGETDVFQIPRLLARDWRGGELLSLLRAVYNGPP